MRCRVRRGLLILLGLAVIITCLLFFHPWRLLLHPPQIAHKHTRSSALLKQDMSVAVTKASGYVTQTQTSYVKLEGVDSTGHDMFMAYGAPVDQLKVICTSLVDCEGFNSEGWVKSRVDNKQRVTTIDLYVKHRVSIETWRVESDSDAGVFRGHMTDYDSMNKHLKIYIYDTEVGQNMPSFEDYKYGVEYLFISLLAKSRFRTKDPGEATFYFLPARCTAYRKSVSTLAEGIARAANTMSEMLEDIKHTYPYWNNSLGADHFYVCAHDMGTDLVKNSDPNLWKNSIGLVNTADSSEPMFVPHKDISLPPHPGRGTIDWAAIGQGGVTFDPSFRTTLAFMAGHPGRGPVRPLIYQLFGDDIDFHLVKGYISDEDYTLALKTSKFCLCPRGNKAWSPRLMDALWFGCIPVIIADHYILPLSSLVDWGKIAVVISENQVSQMKQILLSIADEQVVFMQVAIQAAYRHLTWNDPPQPYDAFHSVLYQLWQKRNIKRKQVVRHKL